MRGSSEAPGCLSSQGRTFEESRRGWGWRERERERNNNNNNNKIKSKAKTKPKEKKKSSNVLMWGNLLP